MRKILVTLLFTTALLQLLWPAVAQETSIPALHDPSDFRPLGRFVIPGDQLISSPDTLHVLALTTVQVEIFPEVIAASGGVVVIEPNTSETPTELVYEDVTTMRMWDLRGGKQLWEREIEDRQWLDLAFSPDGDTLYIRSVHDQADDNPENDIYRMTVYDPLTGEIITRSENINSIEQPLVPGEMRQPVQVASQYMTNQRFLTTVSRPLAGTYCSAWDVQTTQVVWSQPNECGVLSPARTYMAVREPHQSGSAYDQITIYDFATGERLISSPDEVLEFSWLDEHTITIHRPYGDPPVVWEILNNTRAVIEQPYRLGIVYPADALTEIYLRGGEVGYFVWDKTTGKLLRETEINGRLFALDNRMVVLETNMNWQNLRWTVAHSEDQAEVDEAAAALEKAFLLRDFISGAELWAYPYQHSDLWLSPDNTWGYAYDQLELGYDFFDLRTGEIWGTMPAMRGSFTFTQDMQWAMQAYGNFYTIWGEASELDRFENQPNSITKSDRTPVYSSPRRNIKDYLPANAHLWVYGQTEDGQWLIGVDADGSYIYFKAASVQTWIPTQKLPVF